MIKKNRIFVASALALSLFATPQAKPGWFSPKVKAIGGGIATATCLITAGICYKKLHGINKTLNNPLEMELLTEDEIENLKSKQKWCQVGFWGGAIASVPCGIITGMGIAQWTAKPEKKPMTFFELKLEDGKNFVTIFDKTVEVPERRLEIAIKFLEKLNDAVETEAGEKMKELLFTKIADPAITILAGTTSALKKIRAKEKLGPGERKSLAMVLGGLEIYSGKEITDMFDKLEEVIQKTGGDIDAGITLAINEKILSDGVKDGLSDKKYDTAAEGIERLIREDLLPKVEKEQEPKVAGLFEDLTGRKLRLEEEDERKLDGDVKHPEFEDFLEDKKLFESDEG
jgi:hypothetical protein